MEFVSGQPFSQGWEICEFVKNEVLLKMPHYSSADIPQTLYQSKHSCRYHRLPSSALKRRLPRAKYKTSS